MIIRHAEKPGDADPDHGVTINGVHDKHELTVSGWQRAGALVRYFAPWGGVAEDAPISTPRSIFASAATYKSPSFRAQRTVEPLADALGLAIDTQHANGDEIGVAAAVLRSASPVLIAWHHNHIARLARAIAGEALACPEDWPDDRFDMVWVLDRDATDAPWRFAQATQRLLVRDRDWPI